MPRKKKTEPWEPLISVITEAMADRKAREPVILNLSGIKGAVCDAFVICHGTSVTQVEAISNHLIREVRKKTGIHPGHTEGMENAEWILIDYFDVVIHVFLEERRKFYNLEQLWADAEVMRVDSHE